MLLRGSSLRVPGGLCGRSPGRPRLLFLGGRDCSTWWGGEEARRAPERAPNSCLAVLGAGGGGGVGVSACKLVLALPLSSGNILDVERQAGRKGA